LLTELGSAVYRGDEEAAAQIRAEVAAVDASAVGLERAAAAAGDRAHVEIEQARLEAQPTEVVKD
jgi:hypothetical protein